MVRLAVIFYAATLAVAAAITHIWGSWSTWFPARDGLGWAQDIAGGVAIGLAIVVLTQTFTRRWSAAAALTQEFAQIFGPRRTWEVAIMALTSGIAEEAMFRSTIQPFTGWIIAGILFGLLHTGPKKEYAIWTGFAVLFGLLIGAIVEFHPGLALPAAVHITVNFFNMKWIVSQYKPELSLAPQTPTQPS